MEKILQTELNDDGVLSLYLCSQKKHNLIGVVIGCYSRAKS